MLKTDLHRTMNIYKIKTFWQIESFHGWADKNPRPGYVKGQKFIVSSDKDENELYREINSKLSDDDYVSFQIDGKTKSTKPYTVEQFVNILKSARLELSFTIPTDENDIYCEKASCKETIVHDKVFVTNATARSIAYHTCLFLQGEKNPSMLHYDEDEIERIKDMFVKQSTEFLDMYMRVKVGQQSFLEGLTEKQRLKFYKECLVKNIVKRSTYVYHATNECKRLLSDYDERRKNTGVFMTEEGFHLDKEYLKKLGFRGCGACYPEESPYEVITSSAEEWGIDI